MSQIFSPAANNIARLSLLGTILLSGLVLGIIFTWDNSAYTRAPIGIAVEQPVRFSHELHSGQLNVECQYCHTSVAESSYAGIPDTHTCMSCHSQIATYSELLASVRSSYDTGENLVWNRVHDLADHVYFNHSAHINSGFGCDTCHGNVEEMPIVWQAQNMTMAWCLDCHRNPEDYIRPLDEIYNVAYEVENQVELGQQLVEERGIDVDRLEACSICHR